MHPLFVYGTLMEAAVQRRVIGRELDGIPDQLADYHKSTIQFGPTTYPIAVSSPGDTITGLVITVSDADLILLDDYETSAYRRIQVTLASGQIAWVYCE